MENIEDTRQNLRELGESEIPTISEDLQRFEELEELEQSKEPVPTYYWADIQTPRLSNVGVDIFYGEVLLTQKTYTKNQSAKLDIPTPKVVVYDSNFLRYKLLEVIAPIICDWKEETSQGFAEDDVTGEDISAMRLDDFIDCLKLLLTSCVEDSIKYHDSAIESCEEMGIGLPYTPKFLLRSFKLAKSLENKALEALSKKSIKK